MDGGGWEVSRKSGGSGGCSQDVLYETGINKRKKERLKERTREWHKLELRQSSSSHHPCFSLGSPSQSQAAHYIGFRSI